ADIDARAVVERWSAARPLTGEPEGMALAVRVGHAELGAVVELGGDPDDDAPPAFREAVRELRRLVDAPGVSPWLVDARGGIGVLGPPAAGRAVARSLAVQLLAQCSPASFGLSAPVEEAWAVELPHRLTRSETSSYRLRSGEVEVVIAWAEKASTLPAGLGSVIHLAAGEPQPRAPMPAALGAIHARDLARQLARLARDHRMVDPASRLPETVSLRELLGGDGGIDRGARLDRGSRSGLRAPIGMGADGVVELDLVREGPHAVVAGTTGTGKSEFLVSWVLAMASRHPPSEVTFLLIDFKGGAAFAPLLGVPHVVGIVSDLDARRSRRAIESLRAELRRRELLLAERGVRSLEELHGELARLVIVVDEFAAVVSGQPELHEVFADLAARGRSLGLHLVLCTQRPAGVIRDGVLANVALRISLRVTDRGDSAAMLGSDAAFTLTPTARGRAIIADGSGVVREVQLARAEPDDAERLRDIGPGSEVVRAPVWCDPLPELLLLESLRLDPEWDVTPGIPFGRLDLPAEQRQPFAVHDPTTGGHLLVLGAARAGRTTALATFAADPRCRVLPRDPADAWSSIDGLIEQLAEQVAHPGSTPQLGATGVIVLLIDDLDVLIDSVDPDARHEFVDRFARLARESRAISLIASAQRITAPLQRLAGLFEARLLLRQPSRDEHVLAGGDGATYDPRLPPGAGTWRGGGAAGVTVQVAIGDLPLPSAEAPELPRVRLEPGLP
ncbi:MAG: FtsK/SpoIIIE domain-containing protein, partial [Actinomycetota bacterium]|nr:FtsK/SpoIIIE domain-containing protein [Actinomycetota bacterium]